MMQQNIIGECIENGCLLFGEFTLKSGKQSPFFFNATFDNGQILYRIAEAFADHLYSNLKTDLLSYTLFGAAYKGIPLVTAIGTVLYSKYKLSCNIVFNRKEIKDHGEGGSLVGQIRNNKIIVIDDVLTRGTALHQVIKLIETEAPQVKIEGVVILLDRMEKVENTTAKENLTKTTGIKIDSLVSLMDIINYLEKTDSATHQRMLHFSK